MIAAHPIEEMVRSALAALADDLPATSDVEQVELVLEHVGDAVRAAVPLPLSVSSWSARLAGEVLGGVAARWAARLDAEVLPGSDAQVDRLCTAAVLRDRAESTIVAVRRACVTAGRAPSAVPGFDALLASLEAVDVQLEAHVSRPAVEAALGLRRGLLGQSSWPDRLAERTGDSIVTEAPAIEGSLPVDVAPSDTIVSRYIARGLHAAWIEAVADRSSEFSEELAALIEALRSEREQVSLVARRWQAGHRSNSDNVATIGLELRSVAADGDTERVEVQLGTLAPTEAQARVIVESGRVTVRVLAASGSLRSMRLGQSVLERESAAGRWELSCAWTEEPISFEVESVDGRRFMTALRLHAGSDA